MLDEDDSLAANRIVAIVDDDEAVRQATASLVRSLGHEVRGFASAEDFLRPGSDEGIDCLVTDVHMPGIDGTDLQLAHARRIDDPRAAVESKHFSRRCRVTAFAVVLSNAARRLL